MIKFLLAGALAVATPAFAQTNSNFVGTHAQVQMGVSNHNIDYGVNVGQDFSLGDRAVVGVDANATNIFDRDGRILGVGARLGYAVNSKTLAYGRVGYANLDAGRENLNGVALGGGLQFSLPHHTFISTEYRYTNYEQGAHSHAGLLGFGIQF